MGVFLSSAIKFPGLMVSVTPWGHNAWKNFLICDLCKAACSCQVLCFLFLPPEKLLQKVEQPLRSNACLIRSDQISVLLKMSVEVDNFSKPIRYKRRGRKTASDGTQHSSQQTTYLDNKSRKKNRLHQGVCTAMLCQDRCSNENLQRLKVSVGD